MRAAYSPAERMKQRFSVKDTVSGTPDAAKAYFGNFSESRMQDWALGDDTVLAGVPDEFKRYVIKFFNQRGFVR